MILMTALKGQRVLAILSLPSRPPANPSSASTPSSRRAFPYSPRVAFSSHLADLRLEDDWGDLACVWGGERIQLRQHHHLKGRRPSLHVDTCIP